MTMTFDPIVARRRAVEALRAGVPSRDAVVDAAELDQAYERLKRLHADAFEWQPPDVAGLERLGANRMRQYVRAWINEWDLVRLDPAYRPDTETVAVRSDYREDDALTDDPDGGEAPER